MHLDSVFGPTVSVQPLWRYGAEKLFSPRDGWGLNMRCAGQWRIRARCLSRVLCFEQFVDVFAHVFSGCSRGGVSSHGQ